MKSSSSVRALRPDAPEAVFFSRWALADLRVDVAVPEADGAVVRDEEAALREEREAAARAEAEERFREAERLEAERRAEEELERRVREAYSEGYEEGRREGEIAEGMRLRNVVRMAEEALDELRAGEARWTGSIEENVCALAVAVARHVIGRELAHDVSPVMELVRGALAEFPVDQAIRIRVNPGDLVLLRQLHDGEAAMGALTQGREARWVTDAHVAPGGCVVEGRERIVDGRVDTALERVYRRLTYVHA